MRQSHLIGRTSKEAPKSLTASPQRLLFRAGFLRPMAAGLYSYPPLMVRTLKKIRNIMTEELEKAHFGEIQLPSLQPRELWEETGRWDRAIDPDGLLFSFRDRRGSYLCLGLGPEEAALDLLRKEISSYKHLPRRLFQMRSRFLDEPRPRAGILQGRETSYCEAFSLDADETGLQTSYQSAKMVWDRIAQRIELSGRWVEAVSDIEAGLETLAFWADSGNSDDQVLACDSCGYAAERALAESRLQTYPQDIMEKTMEAVYGPGLIGVQPLAEFLGLPVWKTTKTLLFQADEKIAAVMVRGDCDVNEYQVKTNLGCRYLALASPETILELTDAEVGYAGPIGLPSEVRVLADIDTDGRINFECGANRTDYHYINVNVGRDFPPPILGHFKQATTGQVCGRCRKGTLTEIKGIRAGRLTKTGYRFTGPMKCAFLNQAGQSQTALAGSYSWDLARLVVALAAQHHDEAGLIWPLAVAPFQVHLIGLNLEKTEVRDQAEKLYQDLMTRGYEVLFDEREARAGEKFSDADLIGLPVRLTVSQKTCQAQKLEFKARGQKAAELMDYEAVLSRVAADLTRRRD